MNRRDWAWWMAAVTFVALVALSAPAFPQQPAAAPATAAADPATEDSESSTIETILRQQREAVTEQRFSYEPAGRRDPFLSLMTPQIVETERPPGAAGMLISELDVAGVVRDTRGGDVAMVIGSDNKGYFLRVGDSVFDGTVISVDPGDGLITFRQEVDDPRLIKPYRDVVKRLVPLEENSNE